MSFTFRLACGFSLRVGPQVSPAAALNWADVASPRKRRAIHPPGSGVNIMLRIGIAACAWWLAASNMALAETPWPSAATISSPPSWPARQLPQPRDGEGKLIADRALSGGLAFATPAFDATAPNITPDADTGIGSWSDAEIETRVGGGHAAGQQPSLRRVARGDHARQFLQGAAARRSRCHRRLSAPHCQAGPEPGSRSRLQGAGAARSLSGRGCRFQPIMFTRSGPAQRLSRHHRPLHGMPLGLVARRLQISRPALATATGSSRCTRDRRRAPQPAPPPISRRRIRPRVSAHGAMPKIVRAVTQGVARDGRALKPPMAYGYYAALKPSIWPRHHRLSAHRAAAAMTGCKTAGSATRQEGDILVGQPLGARSCRECPRPSSNRKPRSRPRPSGRACTKVILVNDDFTPREFVVTVLKAEFRMTEDQAHKVMSHRAPARRLRGCGLHQGRCRDQGDARHRRRPRQGYPLLFTARAGGMAFAA